MRRIPYFVSCLVLVFCVPQFASAKSSSANNIIKDATSAFSELDFEKALALMKKAEAQKGNSRDQMIHIFHIEGLCLSTLGKYKQARATFLRLLSLDPSFRLGADVSPRVKKPFEEARKHNHHQLQVRAIPPAGAWKDEPTSLYFEVIADPARMLRTITLWYKSEEQKSFKAITVKLKNSVRTKGKGRILLTLPVQRIKRDKGTLSWYAVAQGEHFSKLQLFNDAAHPAKLEIVSRTKLQAGGINPWYKRWWVWTIVGGVAIAGATTAAVLTTSSTDSGPFDFDVSFSTAH